jgi:ATP-dependent Clp protease ATP-binding subunit ClpA
VVRDDAQCAGKIMFERYNERARRVVFFARFEASQYGSHVIETEHLLLGLVRENGGLIPRIPGETSIGERIRTEIERRGHEEIWRKFDALFAPYAKRNATYAIESTLTNTDHAFVATVLWKNALLASEQRAWLQRMSVVLVAKDDEWEIVLIQVTLVQP